jgi:hypothetical protein
MELLYIEPEIINALYDMNDIEIRSFAELQEDPTSDAQIELFLYTCFLIVKRTKEMEYLEQAIQRAEEWAAVTAYNYPDQARRTMIFNSMFAWKWQLEYALKSITGRLVQTNYVCTSANH